MLDGFIRKFVLCPECDNPETDLVTSTFVLKLCSEALTGLNYLLFFSSRSMSIPRNKPLVIPVRPVDTAACSTPDTSCAPSSSKTHQVTPRPPLLGLPPPPGISHNDPFASPVTESTEGGSASVKKEKEKKNRKKDKENGSGSGEAGSQENFDAPKAVVGF